MQKRISRCASRRHERDARWLQDQVGEPLVLPWLPPQPHRPAVARQGAGAHNEVKLAELPGTDGSTPGPTPDFSSLPRLKLPEDGGRGGGRATPCSDEGASQPVVTRGLAVQPPGLGHELNCVMWLDQNGALRSAKVP